LSLKKVAAALVSFSLLPSGPSYWSNSNFSFVKAAPV
jgi:hypothetical protein